MPSSVPIQLLGMTEYTSAYQDMLSFNEKPDLKNPDQIWVTEHLPVYTLGYSASEDDIHVKNQIPAVHVDRGGQVTYHGPGQLIIYPLLDLKKHQLLPTQMVGIFEQSIIYWLDLFGVEATTMEDDRGVYTSDGIKIASIGLRIRNGRSYHGVAINLNVDLKPFYDITVCGKKDMQLCSLYDIIGRKVKFAEIKLFISHLAEKLGCINHHYEYSCNHEYNRRNQSQIAWQEEI